MVTRELTTKALYLSAGHFPGNINRQGKSDPGAVGNGYKEAELTAELRTLVEAELKGIFPELLIITDNDNQITSDYVNYLAKNVKAGDFVLDIHFNAATPAANGTEVVLPKAPTELEVEVGKELAEAVAGVLETRLRGNGGVITESETARGSIGILSKPATAVNLLLEVCFITNKAEIEKYQQHKITVAKHIAAVIKRYMQ